MTKMSVEYGMQSFVASEKYKSALKDLRRAAGIANRAEKRLLYGNTVYRRRTPKATKTGTSGSPAAGESGGHGDREDRETPIRTIEPENPDNV